MNNTQKNEVINSIGIWALRLLLVGGAIYCGVTDKNDAAGLLACLVVASFLLITT